jgi:hypothetical protein
MPARTNTHHVAGDGVTGACHQLAHLIGPLFPPRGRLIQESGLSATDQLPPASVLHLRRIFRLVKRHGPRVWGLWRGDTAKLAELEAQGRLMRWLDNPDHG